MKNFRILLILCSALMAFSCSIKHSEMLTVIYPDGSCLRQFSGQADSAFMCGDSASLARRFPVVVDPSWKVIWTFGGGSPDTTYPLSREQYDSLVGSVPKMTGMPEPTFQVTVSRVFRSVDEMASHFRFRPTHPWSRMNISYAFERQFLWFYTNYHYRETYKQVPTVHTLPLEDFMTRDEATFWFSGNPNLIEGMNGMEIREYVGELEDKYNHWLTKSLWDAQFRVLLREYDQLSAPRVSKDSLAALKDKIYFTSEKEPGDPHMEETLNKFFKTRVFSELWREDLREGDNPLDVVEDEFVEQDVVESSTYSFTYKLIMPGTITSAGGAVVQGDTLIWPLTAVRMIPDDYVVEAHSKKANIWAFVLTAGILIIAVASFLHAPSSSGKKKTSA